MAVWCLLEAVEVITEGLLVTVDLEILQLVVPPDALFKMLALPLVRSLLDLHFLTGLLSELPCKPNFVDC